MGAGNFSRPVVVLGAALAAGACSGSVERDGRTPGEVSGLPGAGQGGSAPGAGSGGEAGSGGSAPGSGGSAPGSGGGSSGGGSGDGGTGGGPFSCIPERIYDAGVPPPPETMCGVPLRYELTIARELTAPSPNGTGIAVDGDKLWLLYPEPPAIVLFDPESQQVLARTQLPPAVVAEPGSLLAGITRSTSSIWINVARADNATLFELALDGTIKRTLKSPAYYGPVDLEFKDGSLLASSGLSQLFVLDPASGSTRLTYAIGDQKERDGGIAVRPGELWAVRLFGPEILIFQPDHGTLIAWAAGLYHPRGGGGASTPMAFAGQSLVTVSDRGIIYYDITPHRPR
jgi:hypothetical protein